MKEIREKIKGTAKSLAGAVGMRDFFVFGGLVLMGYGLWLFAPWVSFTVCGAVMLGFGIFAGGRS